MLESVPPDQLEVAAPPADKSLNLTATGARPKIKIVPLKQAAVAAAAADLQDGISTPERLDETPAPIPPVGRQRKLQKVHESCMQCVELLKLKNEVVLLKLENEV